MYLATLAPRHAKRNPLNPFFWFEVLADFVLMYLVWLTVGDGFRPIQDPQDVVLRTRRWWFVGMVLAGAGITWSLVLGGLLHSGTAVWVSVLLPLLAYIFVRFYLDVIIAQGHGLTVHCELLAEKPPAVANSVEPRAVAYLCKSFEVVCSEVVHVITRRAEDEVSVAFAKYAEGDPVISVCSIREDSIVLRMECASGFARKHIENTNHPVNSRACEVELRYRKSGQGASMRTVVDIRVRTPGLECSPKLRQSE